MGKKLRSFLTIGGVILGIGAIVFLVSLGYGLQELLVERITGLDALRIIDVTTVKSQIIRLNDEAKQRFLSFEPVEQVELQVNLPGRIRFGGSSTDVVVFGATKEYLQMASVKSDVGNVYENNQDAIIVNTSVLNLVGVDPQAYEQTLGKDASIELVLLTELLNNDTTAQDGGEESTSVTKELPIVGIIDDNETPYVYIPLSLLRSENVVNFSQAKVKVKNQAELEAIRNNIESLGFNTSSAADTVQQIDQIFTIFRVVLAGFGAIGLIVAALGMFNTLTVSLLERTREIGLMKALGAKRKDIFLLFLVEALLISGIGGLLGIGFGYLLGEGGNFMLNQLAQATGNDPVDIFYTPVVFMVIIFVFSLSVGFLTGLFPSQRAGKLNPLDALRYE
ncbi:ABC transporter permease [candidate division WWE3 bacterium]|uniref:ABC transporter permease n=1 Tax=candidate division WWE3 bacterium TaxID=2053526 RepID=A0A955RR06_UNCKA|nr:ABC transporter permease [candidate division WWE3 bacterium]